MINLIFILIGIVVGAFGSYLLFVGKFRNVESSLLLTKQQLQQEQKEKKNLQDQLTVMENDNKEQTNQLTEIKVAYGKTTAELLARQEQNSMEMKLRKEQFEQQLRTVQEQFSNLATNILTKTSSELKSSSMESMENITKPLKQNIEQLHVAIQATNKETVRSTASLSQQLKEMNEQTKKIDQTATRLTNVIRGGNKTQGNWGERMLTELLDMQGFRLGIDYDIQQTLIDEKGNIVTNTDSGKKMIPDVIIHYPMNEDVVVDSKMSIDAYYQYVNTDNETLKKKYADDLVRSVRTQASNLARKDYSRYIKEPRKAIDFVIMFVPNEGALQLALANDSRLWGEAFDKQVFITSQQNLLAVLKMIQMAWRQYAQTESQKNVFILAEEMLKRVGEFIKRFDKVGKDIDAIQKDFFDAHNKVYTGRQSVVQKANELKEIGVKESANQPIPSTEIPLE